MLARTFPAAIGAALLLVGCGGSGQSAASSAATVNGSSPAASPSGLVKMPITKYLKYGDQKGIDYTYDFFVNVVWPDYPHVAPEQLSDGLAELGKANEKLRTFNPAVMLDDSFVQDAEKRGLARK